MLFFTITGSGDDCTLLRNNNPYELTDLKIPKLCGRLPREAIGSVNGLVCLSVRDGFYVWNPFIRKGWLIPQTPAQGMYRSFKGTGVFFVGFGFDPRTIDYKLIVIPLRVFPDLPVLKLCRHQQEDVIYMFSANNSSWKQVHSTVEDFIFDEGDHGISLGGSIYWLARTKGFHPNKKKIISFDFESERFREIMLPNYQLEMPDEDFTRRATFSIQVIDESIHLAIVPNGRSCCHVWTLYQNRATGVESWIKKDKIVLPEALWFNSRQDWWVTGLTHDGCLWATSFDKDDRNYTTPSSNYLLYDPKSSTIKDSHRAGLSCDCICLTESLAGLPRQDKLSQANFEGTLSFGDPHHGI